MGLTPWVSRLEAWDCEINFLRRRDHFFGLKAKQKIVAYDFLVHCAIYIVLCKRYMPFVHSAICTQYPVHCTPVQSTHTVPQCTHYSIHTIPQYTHYSIHTVLQYTGWRKPTCCHWRVALATAHLWLQWIVVYSCTLYTVRCSVYTLHIVSCWGCSAEGHPCFSHSGFGSKLGPNWQNF